MPATAGNIKKRLARSLFAIGAATVFASIAGAIEAVQANGVYPGTGPTGPLYAIDAATQDLALRAREPTSFVQMPGAAQQRIATDPRDVITIVAIDDPTIAELGAYNGGYPRSQDAAVVEQLLQAPPRVIAFDVGFFEPTADDEVLGAALDHARSIGTRVVLADVGLVTAGRIAQTGDGELQFGAGLEPVGPLATHAEVGLANVLPDTRGTIRSMPLLASVGNTERPTLGLAALAAYLRRPRPIDAPPQSGMLQVAGREVPVDATDSLLINYLGAPGQTFPVVSFGDVLRGRADPSTWRDRIVFVGALGATGLAEDYWTPVSDQGRKMAGVEIHANVTATLFSTQFLRVAPIADRIALGFMLAFCVGLIAANLPVFVAAAATAGVLTIYVFAAIGALVGFGWQLPLADPLLAGLGTYMAALAYRVTSEQRQARGLQAALSAVVPPHVATFIARQPERISLESQRRELTVLFGDLAEFSTFSERSDAEHVAQAVTEFLQAMTSCVFAYGGTLDKFIGDAVMAFWNAPLDDAAHAQRACAAALDMQAALRSVGDTWSARGLARPWMRIGLHTGLASVGNMGTHQRFAYTAVGDTVNLAARLEPLNAEYGSRICLSENCLKAAGGRERWLVRFLDCVAVKGRATPLNIFELLGAADDSVAVECYKLMLERYEEAMRLYRAREFEHAGDLFRIAAASVGAEQDAPSLAYAARCAEYSLSPPAADWDGVHVMQRK